MDNFSTRSPIDYYYNQDRRWDLSDLEDSQGEDGSDEENNQLNDFTLRVKDKYIVVSSLDREWANSGIDETPYNFTVMCGVSNEKIYTTLPELPKNIKSFKIHKMVLPNKKLNVEAQNTVKTYIHNDPYLVVNVGGFNSLHNGSNKNIDLASGIMITLTPLPDSAVNTNYKSVEFKNINESKTTFDINPLSSINSLIININNSIGFPPTKDSQDVLDIDGITLDVGVDWDATNLIIQCKTYFCDEHQVGDHILIKNYKKIKDYTEIDTSIAAQSYNDYINREEGHKIVNLRKTTANGNGHYNNCIGIRPPVYIDKDNGKQSERLYYTTLKANIKIFNESSDNNVETNVTGKLINVNLQSHLFINLESLEKENVVGGQLI